MGAWSEHQEINLICEIIKCEYVCPNTEYLKLIHKKEVDSEYKLFYRSGKNVPMDKTDQFYKLSDLAKSHLKDTVGGFKDLTIDRTTLIFTEYRHDGFTPEINTYQCKVDNRI